MRLSSVRLSQVVPPAAVRRPPLPAAPVSRLWFWLLGIVLLFVASAPSPHLPSSNSDTYAANGNLLTKLSVTGAASGTYTYDSIQPHAVATAFGYTMGYDANGNLLTRSGAGETWNLNWTGFDQPRWLAKNSVGSEFHYNANRSRVMQLEFDAMSAGAPSHYIRKRLYGLGPTVEANYNNTAASGAPTWQLDTVRIYVNAPDGIVGTREFKPNAPGGDTEKLFVYHHDHLGSVESITPFGSTATAFASDTGGKPGRFSEDAWGQRRDPLDWSGAPVTTDDGGTDSLTPRGFTGHEMLDDLGLVHMNGRLYDPLLGRFLSADLLVENAGNLQAYNRYSYVANNPLTLTDPSGFFSFYPGFKQDVEDANKVAAQVLQNTRVQGGLKVAGAFGEAGAATALAAAPEPTLTTKVAAVALGAHSLDLLQTGLSQLATGQETKTAFNQVAASAATSLGANPETAARVGSVPDQLAAGAALAVATGQLVNAVESNLAAAAPRAAPPTGSVSPVPATAEAARGGGQIALVGERGVLQQGQFVNRVFDSRAALPGAQVSGPLGRSFSPGSGVPTTAGEAIQQRGLNLFYPNNAQQAVIYRATSDIPIITRTSIGGSAPEVLIDPRYFDQLEKVREFALPR